MNERLAVKTHATNTPGLMASGVLQRRCASCGNHTTVGGKCEECEKKGGLLQRESNGRSEPSEVPPIVHEVLNSPGQPLDAGTRAFFEPRFGRDFSDVRLYTDAKAAESAQAVNALAYTVGRNIVFGAGQYASETASGRRLLAHELTHTIQQSSHGVSTRATAMRVSEPSDADENEAEAQAARITSASNAPVIPAQGYSHAPVLHRRVGDPAQIPPGLPCPAPALDLPSGVTSVLLFGTGVATLSAAHKAQIESFIVSWRALGASTPVRVDGFASTDGTEQLNWRLSCSRARAVEAELRAPTSGRVPGVPSSSITFFAQGETDEFSTSLDPNRRSTISTPTPTPAAPPPTPTPPVAPACTPRTGATEHGCYCGRGTSCTSGLSCPPVDALDACCQAHDICYTACPGCEFEDSANPFSSLHTAARACDATLCSCVSGLTLTGRDATYRDRLKILFRCP